MAMQGAQVQNSDHRSYTPTQEATAAFQPPASAPQLPTQAPANYSTGYNEEMFNQPGPYGNSSADSVAAPSFQASYQPMVKEGI